MIYLYGIVGDDHPGIDGVSGVGPNPGTVRMVPIGCVQAAVSELRSRVPLDDRDVVRYRDVVDRLFRKGTVLPVRLGTALRDDAALREQLSSVARSFARRLETFFGKVEIEVTATYEDEMLVRGAYAGDEDGAWLSSASREVAETAWMQQLDEEVAADVERRRAEDGRRFLERIDEVAVVAAERPPEPEMALRASVLMERDRLPELDRVIDALRTDTHGRMAWGVGGPLPPYAFAGLALDGES
jgi:Gas vesicle synthesis protein GvpL/GvpF